MHKVIIGNWFQLSYLWILIFLNAKVEFIQNMLEFVTVLIALGTLVFWLLSRKQKENGEGLKKIPEADSTILLTEGLESGSNLHRQINRWSDEFGDIFQYKIGGQVIIIISNIKWLKQIFTIDSNYVGRPRSGNSRYHKNGIADAEGKMWEAHRNFALKELLECGLGSGPCSLEPLIYEEVCNVIDMFKRREGQPISEIKDIFDKSVINCLWTTVTRKRLCFKDPRLLRLLKIIQNLTIDKKDSKGLGFLAPLLRVIISKGAETNETRRLMNDYRDLLEEMVEEHQNSYQSGKIRNFIDAFISKTRNEMDSKSVFYGDKTDSQLVSILHDIFLAGTEQTTTTIVWGILYLITSPEDQLIMQNEIAILTNDSRPVTLEDRAELPWTMSIVDEILRYSSIFSNGVPHRALEGKEFNGYYIPKDAWIMPNLHYIHYNKKIWGDADVFRPERFMSLDKTKKLKNYKLVPFQIGRRACPGENLARQIIFLFIANLFQRFSITFDPNQQKPSLEPKPGYLLKPYDYSIIVKDRLLNNETMY